VKKALTRITAAARGTDNVMPAIIDAVRAYATVGEISDAMREQFGQFDPPVFL
jgi:methylmalonyl-CoA mutase N-terminal domain/subunit